MYEYECELICLCVCVCLYMGMKRRYEIAFVRVSEKESICLRLCETTCVNMNLSVCVYEHIYEHEIDVCECYE